MTTYRDLVAWQRAIELVLAIYKLTGDLPQAELYGLTSQMRRAAVSIPSNIAEGHRRGSRNEFMRFLRISYGSGAELETQIEIIKRLEYVSDGTCQKADSLLTEVMKMINKLLHSQW